MSAGRNEFGLGGALLGCALSAYLFYGAYCSFSGTHWPGCMPRQLDVVAFAFSFISEAAGAYVAGAVAAALGLAVLGGVILLVLRPPARQP